MAMRPLQGKRVLVTGGPTWVAIDDVRVISNISTGEMGLLLAEAAASAGMKVDLLLGPVAVLRPVSGRVHVIRFRYFHELAQQLRQLLRRYDYDVIFHAAAVSDYLCRTAEGKISSGPRQRTLRLIKAPKLIGSIKKWNSGALVVMFKLETGLRDADLLKRAAQAMKVAGSDLAVANTFKKGRYRGFILDREGVSVPIPTKKNMAQSLLKIIESRLS